MLCEQNAFSLTRRLNVDELVSVLYSFQFHCLKGSNVLRFELVASLSLKGRV